MKTPLHRIPVPENAKHPWDHVDVVVESGCWLWRGHAVKGYARVRWAKQHILVHRWMFANYVRPLEDWEEVHHRCRNSLCINPEHLEAVDPDLHTFLTYASTRSHNTCLLSLSLSLSGAQRTRALRVNDYVHLNEVSGTVISIFKKSVLILDSDGEVHEIET